MSEKETKTSYRIRNWSEYNAALKQRGSLTFWVDEKVLAEWLNEEKTGKRGASRTKARPSGAAALASRDRHYEYNGFTIQFSWTPNARNEVVVI